MRKLKLIVVPFWIAEVLRRHGRPLEEVLDYNKLVEIVSREDLSAFLSFQQHPSTDWLLKSPNFDLIRSWEVSSSKELRAELVSAVVPLSQASSSSDYIDGQFVAYSADATDLTYEVKHPVKGVVFLIAKPGFEGSQTTPKRLEIAQAVLADFYMQLSNEDVSREELFARVIELKQVVHYAQQLVY